MRIVIIAHYFPPINSSGAKRAESLSKYFTAAGHQVTVITTKKTGADGDFTEAIPSGVTLVELNSFGMDSPSVLGSGKFEPMYTGKPSLFRRLKDVVMAMFGQIPDPRLPFSIFFLSPWFSKKAQQAISDCDVVIGTTPPWPMVLAALLCKFRFGKPCILDYRDHFSECHEMPGGFFAKWFEKKIDKCLVNAADHVVCISDPMTNYYRSLTDSVETVLNGYDHEIIERAAAERVVVNDGKVRIRYMGIVSPGRIPFNILKALSILKKNRPSDFSRLRFEFYGNASLIQDLLDGQFSDIAEVFYFFPSVPYFESLKKISEADYLLFSETSSVKTLSAQGILTTKLFEYIGSNRPVLGDISPETLAGALLKGSGQQHIVSQDYNSFLGAMSSPDFYSRIPDIVSPVAHSLSRKTQALRYLEIIKKVTS